MFVRIRLIKDVLSSSDVFEFGHLNIQPIIVICSYKFKDVFVVRNTDQLITECCSLPH